ncbi:MAG: S8 family serine peptidase [Akkermansiaceae bacterium]|nr:S8 family serine peptidase [Akkermansiaceae bacterium]
MVSPSPHRVVFALGRGLVLLAAGTGPLLAQLNDWAAAIGADSPVRSTFTSVEAVGGDAGNPRAAFVCGHFEGSFNFGSGTGLSNPGGLDGVVARLDEDPAWDVRWLLQAPCTGDLTITDIALTPGGPFFVCGTFTGTATFGTTTLMVPVGGQALGFIAFGDPNNGDWQGAFELSDLLPASMAVEGDPGGRIFLTGSGIPGSDALAKALDIAGGPLWTTTLPDANADPKHLAIRRGAGPFLYVLADESVATMSNEDVVLYRLNRGDGVVGREARMGSPGTDTAGGLAVPPDGHPRVAFQANNSAVTFERMPVPDVPPLPGVHAFMVRVEPTALDPVWITPLGLMQAPGSQVAATGVAADQAGNAYAAASFDGEFVIEDALRNGTQDGVILGVDAAGVLFEFQRSSGTANELPAAVSAPDRGLLVTVGAYSGDAADQSQFGNRNLPAPQIREQGFFAVASPVPSAELLILRPVPPLTVEEIISAINQPEIGGQVYHRIFRDGRADSVSVYLTPQQEGALDLFLQPRGFTREPDVLLTLNGVTASCGWALGHLNDAATAGPPYSFTYPEPGETVYIYLIDTAVGSSDPLLQAELDTFFGGNVNLTLEPTTLIRGTGDPLVSSVFEHGTKMLSLLAGPDTGAAEGTPVVVKNFDFYPNGTTSTASLLADAIDAASEWHEDNTDCAPGVILIASGSLATGSSSIITTYIENARDDHGLAVIISAGNNGGTAGSYTPAENGSESGVICVGGSTEIETVEAASNTGADVDFFAPGAAVRVVNYTDPLLLGSGAGYDIFTGTSASAALTCALAATHLSLDPWLSPQRLEAELAGDTYATGGGGSIDLLQIPAAGPDFASTYNDWADFHGLTDQSHGGDDDGDGWTNLEEYFYGLDACGSDPFGSPLGISYDPVTDKYTLDFKLSQILLDPVAPGTLRDGSTLVIKDSAGLVTFTAVGGSMTVGGSSGGRTAVSYTDLALDPKCHFRLEFTPSTPSP